MSQISNHIRCIDALPLDFAEATRFTQCSVYVLFGLLTASAIAVLVVYFGFDGVYLADENSIVENSQALLNLITCALFLMACRHCEASLRLLFLFFACLGWAFFLREVDVEKFDLPELVILLGSGKGRNAMLVVFFLSILATASLRFKYYLKLSISFLKTLPGKLILTCGALLICSDLAEKSDSLPHHVIFEELLELVGFAVLTIAAVVAKQAGKKPI